MLCVCSYQAATSRQRNLGSFYPCAGSTGCGTVRSVSIGGTRGSGGPSGGLIDAGWWMRALTPLERAQTSGRNTQSSPRTSHPFRPPWADVVERVVAAAAPPSVMPPMDSWPDACAVPLRPFLAQVRDCLAGAADRLPAGYGDPGRIADAYTAPLGRQLADLASRTMMSELGKAPPSGSPPSSDDRQGRTDLVRRLCEPAGLGGLFSKYPVLARLLGVAALLAAESGLELLARFTADRPAVVSELLGGADPGPMVAVKPGLGDRHRQGRSVTAVSFADGSRVIYKPRSIAAHVMFGEIIGWLDRRVPGAALRTVAAVPRPGYGWLEFVTSEPLPDVGAAAGFYRRQGVLLAALYVTHATDMHAQNLIASGSTPVLIDVETLFHPVLPSPRTTAADPAARALADSVHRSALLPYLTADEKRVFDPSGMGGDQQAAGRHRPRVNGKAIEPAEYEAAVLEGFRLGYDAITGERAAFARLIASFGDVEMRTIPRPTRGYARLLTESTDPELLRDARDRDAALDVLREASVHHPACSRLVQHELTDLWNGDIPLMTSCPSDWDIWTSAGERLARILTQPGLTCALDKVAAMGDADRRDQEWIISASLATRRPDSGHRSTRPVPGPVSVTAAGPSELLAGACGLADQIIARGMTTRDGTSPGRVNWLGLQLIEDTRWAVLPMGADLGHGYLGVALFLAQLAELTGIDRYADVARRAVSTLPQLVGSLDGRPELVAAVGCGGMDGLGGIGYGLARMSRLLADAELGAWALTALELAATADGPSVVPGWTAGLAGCLAAMIAAQVDLGSERAGELAGECADRLTELVEDTDGRCVPGGDPILAGFARGLAGVGWALTRFAQASAEPRHLAVGCRAVERANDQAAAATPASVLGWCSGMAGLLLARTCLPGGAAGTQPDARLLSDRPLRMDLSLCHGELGISDALTVLAASAGHGPDDRPRWHRAGLVLDVIERHTSYCGTPGGVATPGLLNGLAGIGYGLLRLGFPDQVPSVLLLETIPWPANSV